MKRVIGGRAPLLLIAITAETTVARVVPPPDFVHNQYGDLCKGLGHYGPFPNFYVGGTPEYDWKPVGGIADDFERHGYCSTNPTAGGQQVTFGHTRDAVLRCALRQASAESR